MVVGMVGVGAAKARLESRRAAETVRFLRKCIVVCWKGRCFCVGQVFEAKKACEVVMEIEAGCSCDCDCDADIDDVDIDQTCWKTSTLYTTSTFRQAYAEVS